MNNEILEKQTKICDRAAQIFHTNAIHWLYERNKALDNCTPAEKMMTEEGCEEVEDVLGRIEHGIYS